MATISSLRRHHARHADATDAADAANATNDFAVQQDGHAAMQWRGGAHAQDAQVRVACVQAVFQRFGGSNVHTGDLRLQAVQGHQMTTVVDDEDHHPPVVFHGLGFTRRHGFARLF